MFFKRHFCLLVVGFFIAGFFVLLSAGNVNAGALGPGCCINNSGNCAGGCGVEASNCQTNQLGSCPEVTDAANCNGQLDLVKCFVPGAVCNQATNTKGVCGDAPPPVDCSDPVTDCPPSSDPECVEAACSGGSCIEVPVDGASDNPNCNPPEPTGGTLVLPTLGQWGMIIAAIMLGFFAVVMLWRRKDSEI